MPLVAYHLGMVLPGRALMSFGCHSMVSMHLGGMLSWLVFPPNCLGFFLMMTSHLTGYPLRYVGGFKYPMLRKVTSEGRNTNLWLCFLPLVFGNLTTF